MVFNRNRPGAPPVVANGIQPKSPTPSPASNLVQASLAPPPRGAESVIGSDLSIEGQTITIRCKGSLRVNGKIQADVHSMQLVVGEEAVVNGQIAADAVNVFGRVNGAILGARVVLHSSAIVEGDIHSQVLAIEQGASFDGRSRKVNDPREIAPQLESTTTGAQPSHGQSSSPPPLMGNGRPTYSQ